MNPPRNSKWKIVLWLGLFAALTANGLLALRRNRGTDSPAPATAQAKAVSGEAGPAPVAPAEQSASRESTDVRQETLIPVNLNKPADAEAETSGYEMPFAGTNKVPEKTTAMELREKLTVAAADGNVRDIALLLNSGDPASEIEAVRLLARIGSGEALAAALGKLMTVPADSPDYKNFINAFASCRSAAVAEWLTGFLGQTQTEDVRQRVLTILASLRGPEVIGSLAAGLASPIDQMHAKDCAELLARSSDPEQAAVLRNLMETGKTDEIQTSAARGLAHVGSRAACEALVEAGSSAEDYAEVCRAALATVGSSYGQEALIRAAGNPANPSRVRIAAAQALANQPGERTKTVLGNLANDPGDPALQAAVKKNLQAIEQSGTPPQSRGTAGLAGINGELWF